MNKQKGITLIALIITIIVMLILVAVTINVALNGGLFEKARTASMLTQKEAEREELTFIALGELNYPNGITQSNLQTELLKSSNNYTYISSKSVPGSTYVVQGNSETFWEINLQTGEVKEFVEGESAPVVISDDLEKYILGQEKTGRPMSEIFDNYGFKVDPAENSNQTIHNELKISHYDEDGLYFRYGRDVYTFAFDENSNTTNLKFANQQPERNEGKYVRYNGITWIVLRDDNSKVELISANSMGSVKLIPDGEGLSTERNRTTYNNVVEILVNACKTETTINSNIRNVGGPEVDATTMEQTIDFSEIEGFSPEGNLDFSNLEGSTNGFKIPDEYDTTDINQMKKVGILCTDIPSRYWISSRKLYVSENHNNMVSLNLPFFNKMMISTNVRLVIIENNRNTGTDGYTNPVRPIYTMSAGSLNGRTELGTPDDPIILN